MRILLGLFLFINILFGANFAVGYEKDGKIYTFECFAYLAYLTQKNPELLDYFFVFDFYTNSQINPKNAFYVINSKYKSSCSKYPIIAFENEETANNFAEKYFGNVRDFDFALFVANKDLQYDSEVITKRFEAKASRGKNIFETFCKKKIKNCVNLSKSDKEDFVYFLENQNKAKEISKIDSINVPENSKCPVCGMFVAKYPKWVAQIKCKDHIHFFDGVKDMMKFYFEAPKYGHTIDAKESAEIFVSDYYTTAKIEAKKAFFVIGSNVYGPMGHELIAFGKFEDAKEFQKSHNGKVILKFNEISQQILKGLQ